MTFFHIKIVYFFSYNESHLGPVWLRHIYSSVAQLTSAYVPSIHKLLDYSCVLKALHLERALASRAPGVHLSSHRHPVNAVKREREREPISLTSAPSPWESGHCPELCYSQPHTQIHMCQVLTVYQHTTSTYPQPLQLKSNCKPKKKNKKMKGYAG